MYVDDIASIGINLEEVNNRLEEQKVPHEGKELKISKCKTEYIEYKFVGRGHSINGTRRVMTTISDDEIVEIDSV